VGDYFKIREGIATYLCRKTEDGCEILAQLGKSGRWIKFRKPQHWKWYLPGGPVPEPKELRLSRSVLSKGEEIPVSQEEITAILLMSKNEREV